MYLAWKVLRSLSHFRWWEKYASQKCFLSLNLSFKHGKCWDDPSRFRWWDGYTSQKCFYLYFFALSSGTSTNPYFPPRRAFLLRMQFLFWIWVSIFSYKAPTKGHYDRIWALGVANIRVCFMNGSMIEHDGLGITCFSVDILKDMVACWYAWVLKSSSQN